MITTTSKRAAVVVATVLAGCSGQIRCLPDHAAVRFGPSGAVQLRVDVAGTPAQRAHGLMGVRHLDEDSGMAFVFASPSRAPFWMKDTLIPLSVAFWDRGGRIVGIRDMTPCTTRPCRLYRAPEPYVGAVEANRGYFDRHGIEPGDSVKLDGPAACQ